MSISYYARWKDSGSSPLSVTFTPAAGSLVVVIATAFKISTGTPTLSLTSPTAGVTEHFLNTTTSGDDSILGLWSFRGEGNSVTVTVTGSAWSSGNLTAVEMRNSEGGPMTVASFAYRTDSSATPVFASVDVQTAGTDVLAYLSQDYAAGYAMPAGYTVVDIGTLLAERVIGFAYKNYATVGATGSVTGTAGSALSYQSVHVAVAPIGFNGFFLDNF